MTTDPIGKSIRGDLYVALNRICDWPSFSHRRLRGWRCGRSRLPGELSCDPNAHGRSNHGPVLALRLWWLRSTDSVGTGIVVRQVTTLSRSPRRGHLVDACGVGADRPICSWS